MSRVREARCAIPGDALLSWCSFARNLIKATGTEASFYLRERKVMLKFMNPDELPTYPVSGGAQQGDLGTCSTPYSIWRMWRKLRLCGLASINFRPVVTVATRVLT